MSAGPTAVLLRHLPDHRHHPAELTIFTARSGHGRPPSYWCPATRRKGGGCSEPRSICPGACSRAVICREGAPRDRSRVHSIGGTPALVSLVRWAIWAGARTKNLGFLEQHHRQKGMPTRQRTPRGCWHRTQKYKRPFHRRQRSKRRLLRLICPYLLTPSFSPFSSHFHS